MKIVNILINILLLIFLNGFNGYAQNISFTASKPYFNYSSTSIHKIFGHDKDNFFILKYEGNRYHIEKLDSNLNLEVKVPLKLHEGLKTYTLESIVHFYNELYIFVSRRALSEIILYYQKIDKETLLPVTGFVEIVSLPFIKGNWADFYFALSRKESKLLIATKIKLHWEKVQYEQFYVYGKDFELLWEKKNFTEFEGQGTRETEYFVDDTGNISILGLLKRDNIFTIFKDIKNVYSVSRYTQKGENYREFPLTLKNKYIRGIKIVPGENGDLYCAGLYSDAFFEGLKGMFFFKINELNEDIVDDWLFEYSQDLVDKLAPGEEPIISENQLYEFVLTDLIYRKDGKLIMIAEQLYNQTYNTYNNLIISSFDKNGRYYWTQVVQKKQNFNIQSLSRASNIPEYYFTYANNSNRMEINIESLLEDYRDLVLENGQLDLNIEHYASYALLAPLDEEGIVIFYNDNIYNIENNDKLKNFGHPKKSYLAAVYIDSFGNASKKTVIKWEKKALYPQPIRYYHDLKHTIVIPAFKGRKYDYYKIKVDF